MSWVWPRLPEAAAQARFKSLGSSLEELREWSATSDHEAAPVAVGGTPVPIKVVQELQIQIRDIAASYGYPRLLAKPKTAKFDREASLVLYEVMDIIPADAACLEVWSFTTLVLLPDVACWRFPERAEARLLGRPRNVFGRLWARVDVVGRGLLEREDSLGEDEFVGIMERTKLAADHRLARHLALALIELAPLYSVPRSELLRDVAKRILRLRALLSLESLSDEELDDEVRSCVMISGEMLERA